jgi:hypothetical protein
VATVHVEGMLRQRSRCNLENHRRELPRGVVVLLKSVDNPLA